MAYTAADRETVLGLVQDLASREEINNLLRERDIPFSAPNWEKFIADRLRPALERRLLTVAELVRFLGRIEEYGHQHVFLYRVPKKAVGTYIDADHLATAAGKLGAKRVLQEPRALDKPSKATIADLRVCYRMILTNRTESTTRPHRVVGGRSV